MTARSLASGGLRPPDRAQDPAHPACAQARWRPRKSPRALTGKVCALAGWGSGATREKRAPARDQPDHLPGLVDERHEAREIGDRPAAPVAVGALKGLEPAQALPERGQKDAPFVHERRLRELAKTSRPLLRTLIIMIHYASLRDSMSFGRAYVNSIVHSYSA